MLQKRKLQYLKAVVPCIDYKHKGEDKPKDKYVISLDDMFTKHRPAAMCPIQLQSHLDFLDLRNAIY
jgi:hypothetical protein